MPPSLAQSPQAITSLGSGIARYVFLRASSICLETGPLTRSASACLGDTTKSIPNLWMSYIGLVSAVHSHSQALHDPASTCLILRDLPNTFDILSRSART